MGFDEEFEDCSLTHDGRSGTKRDGAKRRSVRGTREDVCPTTAFKFVEEKQSSPQQNSAIVDNPPAPRPKVKSWRQMATNGDKWLKKI